MIFKGDGCLDAPFSRLWEGLKLFCTYCMLGYHNIEPIRDNEDFKGAVRNIKNGQDSNMHNFQRRRQPRYTFFRVIGETHSVMVSYITNKKQSGLQSTCQDGPKEPKTANRVIFKEDSRLDAFFLRL